MTRRSLSLFARIGSMLGVVALSAHAAELAPGAPAPGFALKDQNATVVRLEDFRGRWVVIYFYPKDDTPGCTTESCNFRDDLPKLRALGVQILGISVDNTESHAAFAKKYSLPFPILSDEGGTVAKTYDAFWTLGPVKRAHRHTFVIDPDGKIARVYRDVDPKTHSKQVIADVTELQASRKN